MSAYPHLKRLLLGRPIATKHAHRERLSVILGLPVFASDNLSSVAYSSEEILLVLMAAGSAAMAMVFPVSLWLAVLMVIVGFSYYQTIQHYPKGGGTYLVSSENLGSRLGRVAGASLLIDYVLTVSVSISSGVAAVISMAPSTQPYAVYIALAMIALLTIANLRGAKESAALFAIPTYLFAGSMLFLVAASLYHGLGSPAAPAKPPLPTGGVWQPVTAFLLLRAFAASCTAMTGTEAIADGVPAFREPTAKSAGRTLILMITLLLTMFIGTSWAAQHYGLVPMHVTDPKYQTVVAQLAFVQFGNGFFFYLLLGATATILFLAANTSFADFPRLSSFIARDGYLPRQLTALGDKLVHQNGILLLALASGVLVVVFNADTHALIPLYALGVFISFTLSQAGMFAKLKRMRAEARRLERSHSAKEATRQSHKLLAQMGISGLGSLATLTVTLVLLVTKLSEGAWLIVVAISVLLLVFAGIRLHYDYLARQLQPALNEPFPELKTTVLLLVPRMHRGIIQALAYAKDIASDVRALHVSIDPAPTEALIADWKRRGIEIPLVILESPFRSIVSPVIEYIDQAYKDDSRTIITLIISEAIPKRWYHRLLHNNASIPLRLALSTRRNVAVTTLRYFLT